MTTREKMIKRRLHLGHTLTYVADKIGVNVGTYKRWENGEIDIGNVHISKIEKLARVLKCSPAWLVGWEIYD